MTKKNDGKYFEARTTDIVSKLNPDRQVLPNVQIIGLLSESSRQLDVIMRKPEEYDFIAFECKDEKSSTGTPTVEAYNTKLMDVGASHGAIVSNSSFTAGAKKMAAKLGIDLLNLVDSEDEKIKTQLQAHTLLVQTQVTQWHIKFEGDLPDEARSAIGDLGDAVIRRPGKKNATVREIANEFWSDLADSMTDAPEQDLVCVEEYPSVIVDHTIIELPPLAFYFTCDIKYREGTMDITQTEGLFDVNAQSFQTQHLAAGPFGQEIFNTWKEISKEEREALTPSFVLYTRSDLSASHPVR